MMHRAEPFKMTAFEQEAQGLVEKARAQTREYLQKALEDAKVLRERAHREGLQKGMEEGREKGRLQAFEQERARIAQETGGLMHLLQTLADGIEARRRGLAAAAEQDLLRLAIAIAERIVKREMAKGAPIVLENLKQAVGLCAQRRTLAVSLNPEDLKRVEEYVPVLKRQFLEISDIHLVADPAVTPGGCIVTTKEGAVDADLQTQLKEIERQLLS